MVVVRRSSSVTRPALLRLAIVGSLATFAGIALLACPVALADAITTNFENITPGSVNGQQGWKSARLGLFRRATQRQQADTTTRTL